MGRKAHRPAAGRRRHRRLHRRLSWRAASRRRTGRTPSPGPTAGRSSSSWTRARFPENGNCFEEVAPVAPEDARDARDRVGRRLHHRRPRRLHPGGPRRRRGDDPDAGEDPARRHRDEPGLREQQRRPAPAPRRHGRDRLRRRSDDQYRTWPGRRNARATVYLDEVPTLRDTHRADVVSLIGSGYDVGRGACGIAYLMSGNSPLFAPYAYSVVDVTCMTGYYSFGHEIGHNMGLNHARGRPGGPRGVLLLVRLQESRQRLPDRDGLRLPGQLHVASSTSRTPPSPMAA